MKPSHRTSFLRSLGAALATLVTVAACSAGGPRGEAVSSQASAQFTNGGFETGTAGQPPAAPWVLTDFVDLDPGVTIQTPQTYAGLNLKTQGAMCTLANQCTGANPQQGSACTGNACTGVGHTILLNSATGPGTQPDPSLGAGASLRWPRYGNQCALVNQLGNHVNVNQLTQTMTVGAGDVDPNDGKVHVRLVVAPVLENPGHANNQQPYFFVQVTNETQGGAVLYSTFNFSNESGVPWKTVTGGGNTYTYTDWQLIDVSPGAPGINMGDSIKLWLIASGCSLGAHFGELYVDGVGSTLPGLYLSGSAPPAAVAGQNLTYTLTYRNGSGSSETGVVISFTTPPNTTFQSFTPPAGATCTTPAVGSAGTITCTFTGPVAAGATGSMTITVGIAAGATGSIVEGNYSIGSTQETPLLGNKITTALAACVTDSDCGAGKWCDELADPAANACTATLANGVAIPSDPAHNPTIAGMCTTAVGAIVCTSGVCDTNNNECGYKNGDGPCASGTVCQSAVCDGKDSLCGYANGDGPCTAGNAGTVCRSGACSTNGNCMPAGQCNVDADCPAGDWCDVAANPDNNQCAPKVSNGGAIPNDPQHNPTITGTCSTQVGAIVCVSGVCDTGNNECGYANGHGPCTPGDGSVCQSGVCDKDGNCGYANGDGPCTTGNGGVVCRSGMCSSGGSCEAPGSCNVDADCPGAQWCDETQHQCQMKLANGQPIPTDGPHMNPTLNGTCTSAAGALVCASGVCDPKDNLCGLANGDGPCSDADGGASVCRSGLCSTGGVCEGPDAGTDAGATDGGAKDAGAKDGGTADAGVGDSGGVLDAAADASPTEDSGSSEGDAQAADATAPDASDTGSVQGGGLSCAVSTDPARGSAGVPVGVLLALGLALGARRRRS